MKYDVFLICPVRNATCEQKKVIANYINCLENEGKRVYYPARDTNQVDDIGYRICSDNMQAIKDAETLHIFYDPNSQGSLFDLGVAFGLNKKLTIINIDHLHKTKTKSFTNMIIEWSRKEDEK